MGRYDLPSTIGNAVVVEEHEETIVLEGVLGGVTQQVLFEVRLPVAAAAAAAAVAAGGGGIRQEELQVLGTAAEVCDVLACVACKHWLQSALAAGQSARWT